MTDRLTKTPTPTVLGPRGRGGGPPRVTVTATGSSSTRKSTKNANTTTTTSRPTITATVTVRAPVRINTNNSALLPMHTSITSSLGSPTKHLHYSPAPSPASPTVRRPSATSISAPSPTAGTSATAANTRRPSVTFRPSAPLHASPGTTATSPPVVIKNGVHAGEGAGSRRSSFASAVSPSAGPISGRLGDRTASNASSVYSSTSSSLRSARASPSSTTDRRPSISRQASIPTTAPTSPPVVSKPTVTSTTIHSPRHSLTPLDAAKAAASAIRAADRGPVSSPASLPLVMTLPEPTHLPIQRSPKIGRIGFDPRVLMGKIMSRPGSAASLANSISAPATPTGGPSAAAGEMAGAAVKVQAARGLLFAANDPRASDVASASSAARIRSIVAASSGPTPLSQLLGLSKQTRPVVMFTLDELKVLPPTEDVSPYRGLMASALVGLVNIGNTCYMAAALQCLVSIDLLTNYVLNDTSVASINPFSDSKGAMAKAYTSLVRDMTTSRGAVNPRAFKRELEKWAPQFEGYDQQDAQEFLRALLDLLSTDLCRIRYDAKFVVKEADEDALPPLVKSHVAWAKYSHLQASLVADVFAGQLMSSVRCWVCNGVFHGFDVFWDLSVSIPSPATASMRRAGSGAALPLPLPAAAAAAAQAPSVRVDLDTCLREFAKEEELEPNEWYNCPTCKKRQRTSKRLQVHRLPPVLVVHIKRFASLRYKLTTPVDFPLDGLDVSAAATTEAAATAGAAGGRRYRLVAVLEHAGSLSFGHYVASVRRGAGEGEWYRMDDGCVDKIADVMRVREEEWAKSAYVLFYQAVGASEGPGVSMGGHCG
ncbi:hypothetical protein BCR44DRAFT_36451 [Catenaria anguillulae PL171]|uniref:Ubiquitin carboxyl-terminal hydrolase n=1 Tax=Catenaria anguillulae PL171 TaxID=765915 RepID=A0A1Y2HA50_9FUNG|nr:hypothetical protein BCR44DRAFT_36451 [Catenaria anguillulae PL171]